MMTWTPGKEPRLPRYDGWDYVARLSALLVLVSVVAYLVGEALW